MLGVLGGPANLERRTARVLHGRIETRTATVSTDLAWLQEDHHWPGLAAIGKVVRVRETAAKTTTEAAYYLLSTALSGERFRDPQLPGRSQRRQRDKPGSDGCSLDHLAMLAPH